jgi:hypothetical protein
MIQFLRYSIIIGFFLISCEDVQVEKDNPLDPDGGEYEVPTINLSTISNGDTLFHESINLVLDGNELVSEYRFKLDQFDWSNWSIDSIVSLEYLDEGEHNVSFQSRYSTGDTSEIFSISFVVDAVSGPSLMFYPRRHIIQNGSEATFLINVEEVSNFMAGEIHLSYEPSNIEIISILPGSIFEQYNESIFHFDIDDVNGQIDLLMTLLDSNLPSFSGTADIIEITIKNKTSNNSAISFASNQVLKDPTNEIINLDQIISGVIEVE